ncbi:hypothetical protein HYH02_013022 [Chlamydomonas schloesseri]|uniref:2'-5'-oligoadenylate synthetase 1 domain-containing protein n=1 Tax=Chlamydomonas schloesseri TaxID=2026947 RepID=A0A835T4G7_9CHLO|nr:hypothetical protein HYH02_013022 [Chlamydomonas schloesseri]|eukprot:KAG2432300.1 hypothetical protein HYH02_013022 [Chlamydomonas schloesseri]
MEVILASDDDLRRMYLNLRPGEEKSYVSYFNGNVLPLTVRGVLDAIPQAATDKMDRVHVGGSFGRRTLVRGAFDVDLTVFVNSYNGQVMRFDQWTEQTLINMQRDVAAWLRTKGWNVVEVEYGAHYKNCLSVTVLVNGRVEVEVDIKLAANVVQGSQEPNRGKAQRDALMAALWDTPAAQRRADPAREAALAEALTAVVKDTSDRVKSVARLLKSWYKYGLKRDIPHVPSVLLEVVTLAAAGQVNMDAREAGVLLLLKALELLDAAASGREVVVLEAGPKWGYTRAQANSCAHVWQWDAVKVLHPIDPTCNLARPKTGGRVIYWSSLAQEARDLRDVIKTRSMWDLLYGSSSSLAPAIQAMGAAAVA